MGSRPTLDQAATGGHNSTGQPDPPAPLFDRLNPALAADYGATTDDPAGLRRLEDALARGWRANQGGEVRAMAAAGHPAD